MVDGTQFGRAILPQNIRLYIRNAVLPPPLRDAKFVISKLVKRKSLRRDRREEMCTNNALGLR